MNQDVGAGSGSGSPMTPNSVRAPSAAAAAAAAAAQAVAGPSVQLRQPYTQMHHIPHPHAHARHHASYVNQAERLYSECCPLSLQKMSCRVTN